MFERGLGMYDAVLPPFGGFEVTRLRNLPASAAALTLAAALVLTPLSVLAQAQHKGCGYAMVVFDASGSMTASAPSKISYARKAIRTVMPELARHRELGLIVYGPPVSGVRLPAVGCRTPVTLAVAPREDAAAEIIGVIEKLRPDGMTPLSQAVRYALRAAPDGRIAETVVLVTDGIENCGGNPCIAGRMIAAAAPDTRVHVISLGLREEALTLLACLADETAGSMRDAHDADSLIDALRETLECPAIS